MNSSPITPATVNFILQYIYPPSLLESPLPPHLISRPLLQRHHFLALTTENPVEYLTWPSHENQEAITLLEGLQEPHPDLPLAVHYSADPEYLLAHVRITSETHNPSSDLRLVFQWDAKDGWQYHNISLMPFPPNSCPEFSNALAMFLSPDDFLQEQSHVVSLNNDEDGDSYWDTYGRGDDSDEMPSSAVKAHSQPSSEDAYWAQYSNVQEGSGDSTLPSPLPIKSDFATKDADRVFVTSANLRPPVTEIYNPLEPPSPKSLARRLASLSDRPETPPLEDSPSSDSETPSPHQHPAELDVLDRAQNGNTSAAPPLIVIDDENNFGDLQDALQENIRGLYRLWRAGQNGPPEVTKALFLSLVRGAIEQ